MKVIDNGRTVSGSGIWRLSVERPLVALVSAYNSRLDAEAIGVKLKRGGSLFLVPTALREDGDGGGAEIRVWHDRLFYRPRGGASNDHVLIAAEVAKMVGESQALNCQPHLPTRADTEVNIRPKLSCPLMVYATDPSDITTFKAVDPGDPGAVIGSGVAIRSIGITITERAPEDHLVAELPWLAAFRAKTKFIPVAPMRSSNPPFELYFMKVGHNE